MYPYDGVVTAVLLHWLVLHDVIAYLVDVKMFYVMICYHLFYTLAYQMTPVVALPQLVAAICLHAVKVLAGYTVSACVDPTVKAP